MAGVIKDDEGAPKGTKHGHMDEHLEQSRAGYHQNTGQNGERIAKSRTDLPRLILPRDSSADFETKRLIGFPCIMG